MLVQDVMTRDPITVVPTVGIKAAMTKLAFAGITSQLEYVHQPIGAGTELAMQQTGAVAQMIVTLPQKLWDIGVSTFTGGERDPNGPLSVVGVGRIAGEVAATDAPVLNRLAVLLNLLGALNIALFVFNMIPLLPLDGGHIVVALWEGVKRAWSRLTGRRAPKPVDATRLVPLTVVVAGDACALPPGPIEDLPTLREHVQQAVELEHALIPAYLCALYSLDRDANPEPSAIVAGVAVEEMFHMAAAANLLSAIGGRPEIDIPRMLPGYPRPLPHVDESFTVSLLPFGAAAIDQVLQAEHPGGAGPAGATRCGGSTGDGPPASITKRHTPTATSAPTTGPTRYGQTPPHSLETRAAPNQRAGLKQAPVSGPPTMTMKTKVRPIASGPQSLRLLLEKTTARMTSTRSISTRVNAFREERRGCEVWIFI